MRIVRLAALGLALLTSAACSDSNPTAALPADPTGTYALTEADDRSLPRTVLINSEGWRYEITGGAVVLRADGTFTERRDRRVTDASGRVTTQTQNWAGTYTVNGADVEFTVPAGTLTHQLNPWIYSGKRRGLDLSGTDTGTGVTVALTYTKQP